MLTKLMSTSARRSSWHTMVDIYNCLLHAESASSSSNLFQHVSSSSPPPGVQSPHPSLLKIAWRLIILPFDIVAVGVGVILGFIQLIFSPLNLVKPLLAQGYAQFVTDPSSEAVQFVAKFKRDFGSFGAAPRFMEDKFMSALLRSQKEYKLLFVYLHSPNHPDVPYFCGESLCAAPVVGYMNENFIIWAGSIRSSEGSKVSPILSASQFPFCAIILALANQPVFLLEEGIGPKPPEEMLKFLQEAVKKHTLTLAAARMAEKERNSTQFLRQERNAFLRARSDADQLLFSSMQDFQQFSCEVPREKVPQFIYWRKIAASSSTMYGTVPRFVTEGYYSGLDRACKEKKLFFVYLHSPDDPEISNFCKSTLCAAPVSGIINEHFIPWAGSTGRPEGSKMSKSFEASSFPFCAILATFNEEPVFIQQVTSSISSEEMLDILQTIVVYTN